MLQTINDIALRPVESTVSFAFLNVIGSDKATLFNNHNLQKLSKMENKNKNQPAFPAHDGHMYYGGLTQREYASIMAMQGLLSFYGLKGNRINESNLPYNVTYMEEIARYSVRQADALLKALETPKQ